MYRSGGWKEGLIISRREIPILKGIQLGDGIPWIEGGVVLLIKWFFRRLDDSEERWVFPESAIGLARQINPFSMVVLTANLIEPAGEPIMDKIAITSRYKGSLFKSNTETDIDR